MEQIQIFVEKISGEKIPVRSSWTIDRETEELPNVSKYIHEEIVNILFDSIKLFIITEKINASDIKNISFVKVGGET
jgi:hypothetical protein